MTAPMLRAALFEDGTAHCEVAEEGGEVVGFALWFPTFSTWTGVSGVHLEDLYVRPEHRGGGHGRALLAHLASICAVRGWARLEWNVLTWNDPAIGFYRSLGALAARGVADLPARRPRADRARGGRRMSLPGTRWRVGSGRDGQWSRDDRGRRSPAGPSAKDEVVVRLPAEGARTCPCCEW